MDQKAQFELRKSIYWTISIFVITGVIIASVGVFNSYKSSLVEIPPSLRAEMLSLRFFNSCFPYVDSLGKTYPEVIDLAQFTEKNLNACYSTAASYGIKTFNFRLQLLKSAREISTDKYYRTDQFQDKHLVLVYDGQSLQEDVLVVFVQESI